MKYAVAIVGLFVCVSVFASNPGQPLDCSDWEFLEPGYSCVRLFGGISTQAPSALSALQFDSSGRLFRFGPSAPLGSCSSDQGAYLTRRHSIEWRDGDTWRTFAYIDDRCVAPGSAPGADAVSPMGPINPGETFNRVPAFDPANGRMLVALVSSCESGVDCSAYPVGSGDYWVAAIGGFATTFDVLQTFTPQPATLGFHVPYMPEGLPGTDRFDTYWGDLAKPIDFSQAHPLACNYPASPPHVGDYESVPDTVPTPAPGHAVYYLTTTTYQGTTRAGRKTTAGHLSGRDAALLTVCTLPIAQMSGH